MEHPAPEDSKVAAAWEGAPLVSGRRLWAVYARFEGGRTVHVAACYDPADAAQAPGRPAWRTELCDSPLPISGGERTRQELLALAGRHVVFCSNNGAVVALDAVTGRRAWGFRYPRSLKAANSATGAPAPAVAFDGRVFVAPADGGHVYALDAETGRVAWQSGPTEGARILGVARGRLIVTVAGPLRSVRGLSLANGSYRPEDGGWIQDSALLSYGQGLVSDDVIVWPSHKGLYFLDARDGRPDGDPVVGLPGDSTRKYFGNLAYADGVLVVVAPAEVRGYVAESRKIVPRPDTPRERFEALIGRAEHAIAEGQPVQARAVLAGAATSDLPAPLRAWAAARMLQLCPAGTEPDRLPAEVREALRPPLLTEWVIRADGVPVTLRAFVSHHTGTPLPAATPVRAADDAKPCAPDLGPDAGTDHVLKLPHAVAPLRPIAGAAGPPKHLFAAGPRTVIAVPLDRSAAREYEPADGFTHAADLPAGFVAAGPLAVAVYDGAREPVWVFRVPTTPRLPAGAASVGSISADEPPVPYLSSFALTGSWLIARIGDHHLVALDLAARAWRGCWGRPAGRGTSRRSSPGPSGSARTSRRAGRSRWCNCPTAGGGSSGSTPAAGSPSRRSATAPPARGGRVPPRAPARTGCCSRTDRGWSGSSSSAAA
ncbi:outer membrane protein assembly factor BamB family protein [Frigoriglobus tundricola]|uniref:outer membrane protein assembly factor BamB family protein n=1 Tax=Frigoriglobus tundricola TaxID=2774151 RepID=UPI00148EE823|nr:PQQ-binding-like beta-propeller repeat protein [Frigoriglobus tundricola]